MTREMTQANDLIAKMLERTAVLIRMKSLNLDFQWLQEFDLQQIMDSCGRISACLAGSSITMTNFQREAIQNPAFAAYYAALLPMFPEEPSEDPKPTPSHIGRYGYVNYHHPVPARPKAPSHRSVLMDRLSKLLELYWDNGLDITASPRDDLMEVLGRDQLDARARLVYLLNFAVAEQSEEEKQAAILGLESCVDPPIRLDEWQKELLKKPFTATRSLFQTAEFEEVCTLLRSCPELVDIIKLLHKKEITENLSLNDYLSFAGDAAECCALLSAVAGQLGSEDTAEFISFWKKNKCAMDQLRRMEHRIAAYPTQDWDSVFSTYSGYVNLLYGTRFKTIDLSSVRNYQEDILTYAIIHNKKQFIKLVDEHAEQFLSLPRDSLLLQEELYRNRFNLNELTEADLGACMWMRSSGLDVEKLTQGRNYTFPELSALYEASALYITLYQLLQSGSQDYRLRVLRQLRKRDVLKPYMEPELPQLAEKLDIKPLYSWKEQEFGHITGLTAEDAAQMLIHFDSISRLLPGMRCRTDAILVLKNLAALEQVDSLDALKENIICFDAEWHALSEEMGLSEEFLTLHRDTIIAFLCKNGAYITRTYRECLDKTQRESFYRVVKAELMGQLRALKYFEGDLQRELDAPLTERVKEGWSKNISIAKSDMEVRECDDFFSTMLLGVQPQETCMSYVDGVYRSCLLSSFDSNKKVLYVFLHGRVVGRAFLRLTKGRLTGTAKETRGDSFTFVDLEDVAASRQNERSAQEELTLFLESPYISGVHPEQDDQVRKLLIELACEKADELGTMLVLSMDYCPPDQTFTQTLFEIYISKSKAGAQYLDSLDGQATVSEERSYKANRFLVREYIPLRAK